MASISINKLGSSQPTAGPHPDDEFYKMSYKNRGIALIFNNTSFEAELKERDGTERDREALKNVLETLTFDVKVYNDKTLPEIQQKLVQVSVTDHSENDCLVIAIVNYKGTPGTIYTKGCELSINQLVEKFSGHNCPTLAGKPKLFFIQSCQGGIEKEDAELNPHPTYLSSKRSKKMVKGRSDGPDGTKYYSIPAMADILIMQADVEEDEKYLYNGELDGSNFIQALVKKLEGYHDKRDLLSTLTLVQKEVVDYFKLKKKIKPDVEQMCSIISMLTRLLCFKQKS